MWPPKSWESPDGTIRKEVIEPGNYGPKPTENCRCTVVFTEIKTGSQIDSQYFENAGGDKAVILGEANTAIDRQIDKCLLTMNKDEISKVFIRFDDADINFELKLIDFESEGYYYEWSADKKITLSKRHKEAGIDLFKRGRFVDASHRFSRGLKLLLSIPVPVDEVTELVDNVPLNDIQDCKANMYNNLASCYAKANTHETVIELCNKVLELDENNCKALCKRGFAYNGNRDFERAKFDLERVLLIETDNKVVREKLNCVNANISQQEQKCKEMVKKMFGN